MSVTVVFPFDKSLPLPKPLHADAVDDRGGLVLLEGLVQLQRNERPEGEEMGEQYPGERGGQG